LLSRLGDGVDDGADGTAILRAEIVRQHLVLAVVSMVIRVCMPGPDCVRSSLL
jgi:hypothetical protein